MENKMNKLLLAIFTFSLPICLLGQSDSIYLRKIYENLELVKSASYYWHQSASVLYDTVPSLSYRVYQKEFDNPEDEYVGASVANFQFDDTTRLVYFYDGKVKSYLDWENKTIPVDSFQNNPYPFRVVYPPFLIQVRSLLKYALETPSGRTVRVTDFADSVVISLMFSDQLVEVVGNRIVHAEPADPDGDKRSTYEIWISKVNDIPYRSIKRFPDRICWESCRDIKINTRKNSSFVASEYYPAGFTLTSVLHGKTNESNLEGKVAPGWTLKDADNNEIALSGLKSKVLVIQFTGIGCGPCHQSIPSLKKIREQYKNDDVELVSIETYTGDTAVIKKYIKLNAINYKYLVCDKEVKLKYGIQSVPRFFVLDGKRVVRKIITGYDRVKTYPELNESLDRLINE
jgi:thiol-disulfide isomerase/thioredoxin